MKKEKLLVCFHFSSASADLPLPNVRIDRNWDSTAPFRVVKRPLMVEAAVAKEPGEHGQSTGSQYAVEERSLTLQGFRSRAAGETSLAFRNVHDGRKQFRYRPQSHPALAIHSSSGMVIPAP